MSTREYELLLGVLCLLASFLWMQIEIKDWKNLDKNDYCLKASSIKILGALFALFIVGVAGIWRYFN